MQEKTLLIEEPIRVLTENESYLIQELYEYGSNKTKQKNKYSCTFCSSSDALSIYKNKKGIWKYKCFSCGESGDIINLKANKENIKNIDAIKLLCEKYSIELDLKEAPKIPRAINGKVVEFYNNASKEALKEGDMDEAFRNSCEADRQAQNNYYLNFPFLDYKNNPLKVWENVESILNKLDIKPCYNVITKDIDILNLDTSEIDNQIMDIHSICHKYGLKVSTDFVMQSINRIAEKNKYNPVTKWLDVCEFGWDENNGRINELCECLMIPDYFSKSLRNKLVTKWLLNTANIAYNEGYSNAEGCLVLQGPQGCGKTSFIKKIIPHRFLKTGLDLDPSNTDSIRKCIKYWVVELGELDATMKSDQAKLKAFMTESADEFRKSYGRNPKRYNRTTSFYGTVNKSNFLKDETGDRRYWVIPVTSVDIDRLKKIEIEQLWGEVMNLLPSNLDNLNLNKDELKELLESNQEFRVKGSTQILVETGFLWDSNSDDWVFMQSPEIARHLGLKTTAGLKEALESMGAISKRKIINGKKLRGYLVPQFIYMD